MTDKPLISILCATYNHEKYVSYFINSLINQTYENWELIIVDDCSTDNNINEIKKFSDPRIKLFQQEFNQGPGTALNRAFSESKGDIIVDMASDDSIKNDYFEFIIETFKAKKEVGAIYSSLDIMDLNNKIYNSWMLDTHKNRNDLLKDMFYGINAVFSPGMAIRRTVYQKLIPMNISMVQHQDYQWHIIIMSNTECLIPEKAYVNYRFVEKNGISLGQRSILSNNRFNLEISKLMDTFLLIDDMDFIYTITNSDLCKKLPKECYKFIWGMSALSCDLLEKRQWGYNVIMDEYADENKRKILYNTLGFKFSDFLSLAKFNYYKKNSVIKKIVKKIIRKFDKKS